MNFKCQHIKLRSNGETKIHCVNSATRIDSLGKGFCETHAYSGLKPMKLIVEVSLDLECSSKIEQDFKNDFLCNEDNGHAKSDRAITEHQSTASVNLHQSQRALKVAEPIAENTGISRVRAADEPLTITIPTSPNASSAGPKTFVDLTDSESLVERFNFPYNTLGELVEHHSTYLPKAKIAGCEWRMLGAPVQGEINGLPMFRGFALATNGVHVAIETSSGALVFGHANWFVVDAKDKYLEDTLFNKSAKSVSKLVNQINELEGLFII